MAAVLTNKLPVIMSMCSVALVLHFQGRGPCTTYSNFPFSFDSLYQVTLQLPHTNSWRLARTKRFLVFHVMFLLSPGCRPLSNLTFSTFIQKHFTDRYPSWEIYILFPLIHTLQVSVRWPTRTEKIEENHHRNNTGGVICSSCPELFMTPGI